MIISLKLLLAAIFWGGTFVAARIVAQDVPPYSASFLRFFVACLFLVVLLLFKEGRLPLLTRRQGALAVLLGITGVFAYNAFFFLGIKTVAAGRASLIVATNPIFISLFSALLFGERLTAGKLAGIVLCLTGATVVISRGDPRILFTGGIGWGEFFILGCVASWVAYSLIGKLVLKDCPPLTAVTWSCLFGAAALLPFACSEGMLANFGSIALRDWGGIVYLGFFGTVLGFIWYYEGIRRIGPGRASIFINFVPVSGVFFGWLLLDETINLSLLAGAALVIGGVFLTNRPVALPQGPGDSASHS